MPLCPPPPPPTHTHTYHARKHVPLGLIEGWIQTRSLDARARGPAVAPNGLGPGPKPRPLNPGHTCSQPENILLKRQAGWGLQQLPTSLSLLAKPINDAASYSGTQIGYTCKTADLWVSRPTCRTCSHPSRIVAFMLPRPEWLGSAAAAPDRAARSSAHSQPAQPIFQLTNQPPNCPTVAPSQRPVGDDGQDAVARQQRQGVFETDTRQPTNCFRYPSVRPAGPRLSHRARSVPVK